MSTQVLIPSTPHALSIEEATRQDMPVVASMIRSSADIYAEFVNKDDLAEHYVDELWQKENFRQRDFYLGYSEKNETVGTLSLQYFDKFAYVGYLYLDTQYIGRRYGHRFLEFAREEAKAKGMDGIYLICHPQATWAVKAYEKFGFQHYSSNRQEILNWNNGALKDYYEEGFDLYICRI